MSAELTFSGVSFSHRGSASPTVAELALTVGAGEMVALLGASGSGKSTALRLAAGLEEPDIGEVLIDGVDQRGVSPQRRGIAMVFQKPLLFPHLRVIDNVAFADRVAGRSKAAARAAAHEYLDLVHLADLGQRRSRELSGGQEQRVALARALAARPAILLLDEPFAGLDAAVRESLYEVLRTIRDQLGPTIVLVTHDLGEVGLADRVAVLDGGSITAVDSLAALYARPPDVQVARLLGGFTEVPGRAAAGAHHSAAGVVPMADGCDVPEGPAILLLHRQSLRLEPSEEPVKGEDQQPRGSLTGTVIAVGAAGMRQRVTISLRGLSAEGAGTVEAEVDVGPDGTGFAPGASVRVQTRVPGTWVVAAPSTLRP